MLLLMAVTADKAVAERVDQDDNNLPNVPTVASYGEKGNFDFDVFIIGAGTSGIRLAKVLTARKDLDLRVGLAESRDIGGTCVNRGCHPKKVLVKASAFFQEVEQATANGVFKVTSELVWPKLQNWRAKRVADVVNLYTEDLHSIDNLQIFKEAVSVVGSHEVKIAPDATKRVRLLVVATGGKPKRMNIPGINLPNVITSDEALELQKKPESMLVVGGGYIGVELASFFLQVGTNVHMSVRSDLLNTFDSDVKAITEDSLLERGLKLSKGNSPVEIVQDGSFLKVTMSNKVTLKVEYVLLAIGREPLTADLGLGNVNISLDKYRKVPVNKYAQTSAPWVFALGDVVANCVELQTIAYMQAIRLAEVLLRQPSAATAPMVEKIVPDEHLATVLFATPRAGSVGLTEERAKATYKDDVTVLVEKWGPCCVAVFDWYLLKVVYRTSDERLLGIHIAGKGADETTQAFAIVMALNPTWTAFKSALAIHPTYTEDILFLTSDESRTGGEWRLDECEPCPE